MVLEYRVQFITLLALVALCGQVRTALANTWQIAQDPNWKAVQTKDEDKYLLVKARTEKLVKSGQTMDLFEEWTKLKKEFPEINEQDLDIFIEAELLLCEQKLTKAVGKYNDFLDKDHQESILYDAALDRLYQIAEDFLDGREKTVLGIFKIKGYAEGVRIMRSINKLVIERPIAMYALVAIAESYEKREKFNEAYFAWLNIYNELENKSEFESEFEKKIYKPVLSRPEGQTLRSMARCKHMAYKGPKYSASNLETARSYYKKYMSYLETEYAKENKIEEIDKTFTEIEEVDEIVKKINGQLAYKDFYISQYYQKIYNYEKSRKKQENVKDINPANLYNQMIIDKWYEKFKTQYPEDAKEIGPDEILKYINEQPTDSPDFDQLYKKIDDKNIADFLTENWPESKVAKMAEQMLSKI